jgi:ArsR family transcriptional regulator
MPQTSTAQRKGDSAPKVRPPKKTGRVPASRKEISSSTGSRRRLETDTLFELLSDRTRRRLLSLLLDEREVCVCRLAEALEVVQPKISRHLAVLRESGVLISRRRGTLILYRFDPALAGWAVRVISMMTEGAQLEAYHERDRVRLAQAKLNGVGGAM